MHCTQCGTPLPDCAVFCSHCGMPTTSAAPPSPTTPLIRIMTKEQFWAASTDPEVGIWLKRARNAYCLTILFYLLALGISVVICTVPSLLVSRYYSSVADGFITLFSFVVFVFSSFVVIMYLSAVISVHHTRSPIRATVTNLGIGVSQFVFWWVIIFTKNAVGIIPIHVYCTAQFLAFCIHVYTTHCYRRLNRLYQYASPLEVAVPSTGGHIPAIDDTTKAHFLSTTTDEAIRKLLRTAQYLFIATCGVACISTVLHGFVVKNLLIALIIGPFSLVSVVSFNNKSTLWSLLATAIVSVPCIQILHSCLRTWKYVSALRGEYNLPGATMKDLYAMTRLYTIPLLILLILSVWLTIIYFKIHLAHRHFQKEQL